MHAGVLFASLAYTLWGLFPLYFKLLAAVPAFEIVLHRSLWSLVVVLIVLAVLRRWAWLPQAARKPRQLAVFALSAVLLSANWLLYVWAVNHDRVIEASLGYFITPLVNVALGYFAPQRAAAPGAMAGAGPGCRGRGMACRRRRPAALDRAAPGRRLRNLRPAAQDRGAGRARRARAGDHAAGPFRGRVARLGRLARHERRRIGRPSASSAGCCCRARSRRCRCCCSPAAPGGCP